MKRLLPFALIIHSILISWLVLADTSGGRISPEEIAPFVWGLCGITFIISILALVSSKK
ncbi:MAG: hypothetical protein PVK00_04100 [Flavobacteriales bacterium]|jgi:hypothetical protein